MKREAESFAKDGLMQKNRIPAVDKTIRLLEALSSGVRAETVTELAALLDISVTTCFRILRTLEAANWIFESPEGGYQLSAGLIGLLNPVCRYQLLVDHIGPQAALLSENAALSAKISVRQGDEYVTIYSAIPPSPYSLNSRINARFPLLVGATGIPFLLGFSETDVRLLLKRSPARVWEFQTEERFYERLEECRRSGCIRDMGSYRPDICAYAAPVLDPSGAVVCVVTLVGMPGDFADEERILTLKNLLLGSIAECRRILASLPHFPM